MIAQASAPLPPRTESPLQVIPLLFPNALTAVATVRVNAESLTSQKTPVARTPFSQPARVEAPQRLGRKRKDSGSGYWTVSESFAVRERLPEAPVDAPVMVTVYWPAVVPIGGGGTVLPPPPPQFATPMSRSTKIF